MEYGLALKLGIGIVKFLVEGFKERVDKHRQLIGNALEQLEELDADLMFLQEYSNDVQNQKLLTNNVITRALIRELRDCIYKAEDAIDSFVVEATVNDSWYRRSNPNSKFVEIAKYATSVCTKVKQIRIKVEQFKQQNTPTGEEGIYEGPPLVKEIYAPIFKEEEEKLRNRLTKEDEEAMKLKKLKKASTSKEAMKLKKLKKASTSKEAEEAKGADAIFITGTHGSGKTTLAAKMFHDSAIRKHFDIHVWVRVSNPTARNILFAVLIQLNKLSRRDDSFNKINNSELSQLVASCLKEKRFLLVLDNVSEIDDWETLAGSFKGCGKMSKVLITSINDETAGFIDRYNRSIKLNPLDEDGSWSLFEMKVFSGNNLCPPELVCYGKLILKECQGLPQLIVSAGDSLFKRTLSSKEIDPEKVWQEFSLNFIAHSGADVSSYNKLDYRLRACFLYLGIFPHGSKFSVSKLIRMWIAEGFVQPTHNVALERVAESYLRDLINLNLVRVEDQRPDGSAKTCIIMSELLYNFCKLEAGNERENFLQEFRKCSEDGAFDPPLNEPNKYRRVCIHDHISKFIPKYISRQPESFNISLHSFVSHSKEECTVRRSDSSNIRAVFKLLRVLDVKPFKFDKIPSNLCKLVHLRYVTLSLDGTILPESISKLKNIRTLVVHTTSSTLKIEADILKLTELRHLKTNASATLSKISKASDGGERLQLLSEISPKSCTVELFNRTPNLKKLGVRGKLALLLRGNNGLLAKLDKVEKLKLLNDVTSSKHEVQLASLLQPSRFPPNLKSLTLSKTSLKWEHIIMLGSLTLLEELKLKDDAFVGENWDVTGDGFSKLQTLHIEGLHFKGWKLSKDQFPKLRRLMLSDCKALTDVPIELARIPSFHQLHMRGGTTSAGNCAKAIQKKRLQMRKTDNSITFKLIGDL